jgi:hypothetical protein
MVGIYAAASSVNHKERENNGVPLDAALLAQVDDVAKSLGIPPLGARI